VRPLISSDYGIAAYADSPAARGALAGPGSGSHPRVSSP